MRRSKVRRILTRFRAALGQIYGNRLERMVLYRSRTVRSPVGFGLQYCRLRHPDALGEEIRQLAGVETDILWAQAL